MTSPKYTLRDEAGNEKSLRTKNPTKAADEWVLRNWDRRDQPYVVLVSIDKGHSKVDDHEVLVETEEQPCVRRQHMWAEGPAFGKDGATVGRDVCRYCGLLRHWSTAWQNPEDGKRWYGEKITTRYEQLDTEST